MLDDDGLGEWGRRLGLPENAIQLVANVRSTPPSRHVKSRAKNVSGRYASRKMGMTIQFESHKNELAAIYEMEHDPDVLEFYDQPTPIKLRYQHVSGRSVGILHTPDFLVLRSQGCGWEECKTEEDLLRLAEQSPHRYVQRPDGTWECPPGQEYAAQFGLSYRVRSSSSIDWCYQRNSLFLEDYFAAGRDVVSAEARDHILATVNAHPGILLSSLLNGPGINSDDIYALIAHDQIYVDLGAAALAEPDQVHVFRDSDIAGALRALTEPARSIDAGRAHSIAVAPETIVNWDEKSWTILNAGVTAVTLLDEDGRAIQLPYSALEALVKEGKIVGIVDAAREGVNAKAREMLNGASPEHLKEANRRYESISPALAGGSIADCPTPPRTTRRWLAQFREAEQTCGNGYVGLLPRWLHRGNRARKLPQVALDLMNDAIEHDYETLTQKGRMAACGSLQLACEKQGVIPPSYKTFCLAVKQRPRHDQDRKRRGSRAAYTSEPFYYELTPTTPRHGDRPLELAHIDHTELDIELVSAQTGQNLGRPWLTILVDAFSRRILALYVTFDPPSYRSAMMVLRECVSRHGRLPQTLVVDGGKEFSSTHFEALLARYAVTKKTRPGAKARFGSVCERLFGTANTQFIHNLTGNTQIMRNVRQVTKAVNPKELACWTLADLTDGLQAWAYEIYDTIEHPALGESPRGAYESGLIRSGRRAHSLIPYDDDFRLATLPTTTKGTAKVAPGNGVKISYIYYWCDAFRDPKVEKTQVPVRYDPFDVATAYAYVGGRWVRCDSEYAPRLRGHSEREIGLATEELRKQNRNHARNLSITAKRIADFIQSAEAAPTLQGQRHRDTETRKTLTLMEGGRTNETADDDFSAGTVDFDERRRSAGIPDPEHGGSDSVTNVYSYGNGQRHGRPDHGIDVDTLDNYEEYS